MKYKYSDEYQNCSLFWDNKPAKFVKLLADKHIKDFSKKSILDLGAGEGKNAVFLANKGAEVFALDTSPVALNRFNMQPHYNNCKLNIHRFVCDINNLCVKNISFDIIVAYGIFHCLSSISAIVDCINKLKNLLNKGGYFIICTFTNDLPIPYFQNYLDEESLIEIGTLEKLFMDYKIVEKEYDIIEEIHPTSNVSHKHSLIRIILNNE